MDNRSYIQKRVQEARERKEDAANLAELWALNFYDCPDERQFTIWLRRYPKSIIADSIERCAEWYDTEMSVALQNNQRFEKSLDELLRYATGVMIRKTAEANNGR